MACVEVEITQKIHDFKVSCIFGLKFLLVVTFLIVIIMFSHLPNILSLLIDKIFYVKIMKLVIRTTQTLWENFMWLFLDLLNLPHRNQVTLFRLFSHEVGFQTLAIFLQLKRISSVTILCALFYAIWCNRDNIVSINPCPYLCIVLAWSFSTDR